MIVLPSIAVAEERRDLYGDPLPEGAIARFGTIARKHGSLVTGVEFLPDGSAVVTGCLDGNVRLFELRRVDGAPQLASRPRWKSGADDVRRSVTDIDVSADGRFVAAACADDTVRLYGTADGKPLNEYDAPTAYSVAVHPNDEWIVVGGTNGKVRILPLDGRADPFDLEYARRGRVYSVAFSADGKRLAAAGDTGRLAVWEWRTHKPLLSMKLRDTTTFRVAFSTTGDRIFAGGSEDGRIGISIVDVRRNFFERETGLGARFALSPDARSVVAGDGRRGLAIWDTVTWRRIAKLEHSTRGNDMVFSPDGTVVLAAQHGGTGDLGIWDAKTGEAHFTQRGHTEMIVSVAVSPDGTSAATASKDGTARLWGVETGREREVFLKGGKPLSDLRLSRDGRLAVAVRDSAEVIVWDRQRREVKNVFRYADGRSTKLTSADISPNGTALAICVMPRLIALCDIETGETIQEIPTNSARAVRFSPDGDFVLSAENPVLPERGSASQLSFWDVESGGLVRTSEPSEPYIYSLAVGGRHLAASAPARVYATVWNLSTGAVASTLGPVEESVISAVAVSPKRGFVALGCRDGRVIVWRVDDWTMSECFNGHIGCVNSLAFAPDHQYLVSVGNDATGVVWKLE